MFPQSKENIENRSAFQNTRSIIEVYADWMAESIENGRIWSNGLNGTEIAIQSESGY